MCWSRPAVRLGSGLRADAPGVGAVWAGGAGLQGLAHGGVVDPVRHRLRLVRQQRRDAVQHLAEAVDLRQVAAVQQVLSRKGLGLVLGLRISVQQVLRR